MLVTPVLIDRIRGLQEARELVSRINRKETQLVAETILEVKSGIKSASLDYGQLRESLITDYTTLIADHSARELYPHPMRLIAEPEETKKRLTSEELHMAAKYLSTVSKAFIYLGKYNKLNFSLNDALLEGHDYSVIATELSQMAHDKQSSQAI